jgi:antitoxin (DNA-binding transcriptional repressor) of toxin-antitoxin stability system
MKQATVRQLLHNVTGVMRWVEDGETVEVTKRGKVIAELRPPMPKKPRKVRMPDFMARMKSYCGDFVLTDEQAARILAESRGDE